MKLGRLHALKFRMELEFKNLKNIIEHRELSKQIEKKGGESMGLRESKYHTNQNISKIERELEKSAKLL